MTPWCKISYHFLDFYQTFFPLINLHRAFVPIKNYKIQYSFHYLSKLNYQSHIYYTSGSITSHSLRPLHFFPPYQPVSSMSPCLPPSPPPLLSLPSLLSPTALLLAAGKLSIPPLSISTNVTVLCVWCGSNTSPKFEGPSCMIGDNLDGLFWVSTLLLSLLQRHKLFCCSLPHLMMGFHANQLIN